MYKIGECVVYRQWRVCEIVGIETPSYAQAEEREYYKLRPKFDDVSNTTIYVPFTAEDSLHALFSATDVVQALETIGQVQTTVTTVKKSAQLTAYYDALLAKPDLSAYLRLLKEIASKEKNVKKLSEIDLRYRKKVEKLLVETFAVSLRCTQETARKKLLSAIE